MVKARKKNVGALTPVAAQAQIEAQMSQQMPSPQVAALPH